MIATYASVLVICGASLAIGQAVLRLCGAVAWSWLSPAVGLAALCIVSWGTVRLPGGGTTSALVVLVLIVVSVGVLAQAELDLRTPAVAGAPVALVALLAASLPFIAEGHFGILGTGFNPDMSQHLLATSRLAEGSDSPLLLQGYPLGPHSIVAALHEGLGIGLVQGFSGLTVAVAVLASLTVLAAFSELSTTRRTVAALLVGVPYMVASYFAQGAFKETIEALFLLAVVLGLRTMPGSGLLRAVPLGLIAAGSVYAYSFPGLIWLGGAVGIWALLELATAEHRGEIVRGAIAPAGAAALTLVVLLAPEIDRVLDFRNFETFDPSGAGLGNLFGQISPFESLGIWPSGDFRLTPGDGAVPAAGYYLGAALGVSLLAYGLAWCWRRRESALLGGVLAALGIYAVGRITGTPYQAAKAIELIAPVAALAIVLPLTRLEKPTREGGPGRSVVTPAALAFAVLAAGCSALALANAPVGPTTYSPHLTELRPLVAAKPTLIIASEDLLTNQHGAAYLNWELRGGRVCIKRQDEAGKRVPAGIGFVVSDVGDGPPLGGLALVRKANPYVLWKVRKPSAGKSNCPVISVRAARQGNPPG